MIEASHSCLHILLVEDSAADVLLTQEAFRSFGRPVEWHVAEHGVAALDFLAPCAQGERARPDLILLDWNLPLKGGREVLAEIKADPHLRRIPVVVLTTSQAREDVERAYSLGANCYITKPMDFESFVEAIQSLQKFWFSTVTLPRS